MEICLCLLLFFYIGIECSYGGWISSFAVLNGVTDSQGATIFPTIFWVATTILRFCAAFVKTTTSLKLKYLIGGGIWSGIISIALISLGYVSFACYLSAILFGASMSVLYPLVFIFPISKGLRLKDHQTANIVNSGVIAEGILTTIVGILMSRIHINVLFYSLTIIAGLMWLVRGKCL